jgi:hypothetical protein
VYVSKDAAVLMLSASAGDKTSTSQWTRTLNQGTSLMVPDEDGFMCTWLSADCERASSIPRIAGTFTLRVGDSFERVIVVTPNIVLVDEPQRKWRPDGDGPHVIAFRTCTTAAHRERGLLKQPAESASDQMSLSLEVDNPEDLDLSKTGFSISLAEDNSTVKVSYKPPTPNLITNTKTYTLILRNGIETVASSQLCTVTHTPAP